MHLMIDEMVDQVGESQYLSKLDLSKDFYQVPISSEDLDKTAFYHSFWQVSF